ncbi:MAG TPA: hypothetical protein VHA52_05025, partial [Candidatus Babeliaceae bacterium]|nr:hypothetical protein [Candidatus Babeliaceae bacterium]
SHQAQTKGTKTLASNKKSALLQAKVPENVRNIMGSKVLQARNFSPINPPLFFYDKSTLQAVSLIPTLAQAIPHGVKSIQIPEHLLKAAQSGTKAKDKSGNALGYPIAYFGSPENQPDAPATTLFVNIPTASTLYSQAVIAQPEWLNTQEGVLKVTRACLGDFSQLIGMGVFDPCIETIITKALGHGSGSQTSCERFVDVMRERQQEFIQNNKLGTEKPQPDNNQAPSGGTDQDQEALIEQFENGMFSGTSP